MQVFVNEEPREVREGITVSDLLELLELQPRYVAVERNLQLVPRAQHGECILQAEDRLEIVTLVGGG